MTTNDYRTDEKSSNGQRAAIKARRAGEIVAVRAALDRLARVGTVLDPIVNAAGTAAALVDAVIADLDKIVTALVHALADGRSRNSRHPAEIPRLLQDLEGRLYREWTERLADGSAADLDRLTEACRLLHGAALALQRGSVA